MIIILLYEDWKRNIYTSVWIRNYYIWLNDKLLLHVLSEPIVSDIILITPNNMQYVWVAFEFNLSLSLYGILANWFYFSREEGLLTDGFGFDT